MSSLSVWPLISLIAGLIIGTVALIITVVVIIRSRKYLVPLVVYAICLIISLVLIGIFVFSLVLDTDEAVVENENRTNSNTSQINKNTNTNLNTTTTLNVPVYNKPIQVGPTEDDLAALLEQGKLYNSDYSFILEVGTRHVSKMSVFAITPFDGVTDTYVYCYETEEVEYASSDCGGDAAEVFRINVYTDEQWAEVADSPFVGTVLSTTGGYVYEFSHPNGLLPTDVPVDQGFYDDVIASFSFAG